MCQCLKLNFDVNFTSNSSTKATNKTTMDKAAQDNKSTQLNPNNPNYQVCSRPRVACMPVWLAWLTVLMVAVAQPPCMRLD